MIDSLLPFDLFPKMAIQLVKFEPRTDLNLEDITMDVACHDCTNDEILKEKYP
jgi:hypothetical protein